MKLLKRKGFTLVEVLIVVVIIGILAALVLPRLLAQPEKAIAAEAHNMIGVLRRAEVTWRDSTGASAWLNVGFDATGAANGADAARIGELGLLGTIGAGSFSYSCTNAAATCVATRLGAGTYAGATVTINLDTGAITCDGAKYKQATAPTTTSCVPV